LPAGSPADGTTASSRSAPGAKGCTQARSEVVASTAAVAPRCCSRSPSSAKPAWRAEEQRAIGLPAQRLEVLVLREAARQQRRGTLLGAEGHALADLVAQQPLDRLEAEGRQHRVERRGAPLEPHFEAPAGRLVPAGERLVAAGQQHRAPALHEEVELAHARRVDGDGVHPHEQVGLGRDRRAGLEVDALQLAPRGERGGQPVVARARRERDARAARMLHLVERGHEQRLQPAELLGAQALDARGRMAARLDRQRAPHRALAVAVALDAAHLERRHAAVRRVALEVGVAGRIDDLVRDLAAALVLERLAQGDEVALEPAQLGGHVRGVAQVEGEEDRVGERGQARGHLGRRVVQRGGAQRSAASPGWRRTTRAASPAPASASSSSAPSASRSRPLMPGSARSRGR
jgi:hypothetical protein